MIILSGFRGDQTQAMRTDGGDGTPSHRTLPFLFATSTDRGRTWTDAAPLPVDMLSSQPKAAVLGNGALLVTAGRSVTRASNSDYL